MIVQFSNGGGIFNAGKGAPVDANTLAVEGCVAGALHVRQLAKASVL